MESKVAGTVSIYGGWHAFSYFAVDAGHRPDPVADSADVFWVSGVAHEIILEAEVVAEDDEAAVFSGTLRQGLSLS